MMDHLWTEIVELLLHTSLICVLRKSLCVALKALTVAPWMASLQPINWLYVYSHRVWMSVLVH